jgi:hypothetical protein
MQTLNANMGPMGRNPGALPVRNSQVRQAGQGGITQRRQNLNRSISSRINQGNDAGKVGETITVYKPKSAGLQKGATLRISDSGKGDVIDAMG